ncbi:regulatory protein, luxR family [Geodermatophilus saharensis]|uniref:Regulatory protein, luxR family n=1 Tax=Geodermatophilus saharensis TaxID=1137994 RepID=A0A239DKA7_9ACTN|nr:LuxR family transcriptional regulator [Geodermatophilus saharensis]SNS32288.1 regulatory protein, luxR family [Geodermatophilus saharensis]
MSGTAPRLVGRRAECERLSGLVAAAEAGRSQVLVLRGEAGIGRTALLAFVAERAGGCRVRRAAGVESERELAFAGLHQLCGPLLDRGDALPPPQREALHTAFGLRPGGAPDRFVLGLAVLSLLAAVAAERPLVCLVDDVQEMDRPSARTLEFVCRRLPTGPVAVVLAVRDTDEEPRLTGLPSLRLRGLADGDAAALLHSTATGRLDPRVRDRILVESRGNPLALLELSRGLSPTELAFGGATAVTGPLDRRLEGEVLRQVAPLPEPTRRLLLTAAAEPTGDLALLWRAAGRLGIGPGAAGAAEASGLVTLHHRVRFRHPLARSAVYRSAAPAQRRAVHRALGEATDPEADPDRRAWHLSRAATGPDEDVAAQLERSAGRALTSGGPAAAAAFLEKAAQLTADPVRRTRRGLQAARAKVAAGAFDDAAALVVGVGEQPLPEAERGRAELLRGRISLAADRTDEALSQLLAVARRWATLDPRLARDAHLDAFRAAVSRGRTAAGPATRRVAEAVRGTPLPAGPGREDALLEGLAVLFTDGDPAAAPLLQRAVRGFLTGELPVDEAAGPVRLAAVTAASLWDPTGWDALTRRHLAAAREAGALGVLPSALEARALARVCAGDLAGAASLVAEARSVTEGAGIARASSAEAGLLAVRGDPDQAEPVLRSCLADALAHGEGHAVSTVQWARAVLANGLGRYGDARRAAEAAADPGGLGPSRWALAELVEAGVRSGDPRAAAAAFESLAAATRASGTEWALGVAAGRQALLSRGEDADALYREAVDRLTRTPVQLELARTRLLHGEWLRREGRRVDARVQLRAAHEALSAMGAGAFAERARQELLATGESVRARSATGPWRLTGQEERIARLAAAGLTNREIGTAVHLSRRTVEWHLRKVFEKLGVTDRRQLRRHLPEGPPPPG